MIVVVVVIVVVVRGSSSTFTLPPPPPLYHHQAEKHMLKLKGSDKEKHRYLEVCKTHPDAHGLDIRSFLIQPVQRVPRCMPHRARTPDY